MSTIAITSSASVSREIFDETKNYQRLIFQQGKPLLDAELNEMQEIIFDYFNTFLAKGYGNLFVDTAMLAAQATQSVNNFQITSGEILVEGVKGYLGSNLIYASQAWVSSASTPNEVYIAKLLWNDEGAVPALTTPSGSNRDDLVVLSLLPQEIDATLDSNIVDPNFTIETARRYKWIVGITVLEGFGSYPETTSFAASFDYSNPQCYRTPIAWLRRTDGDGTVATSMIEDIREEVFDSGETLFSKYRHEIANAGSESNKVTRFRGGLVPVVASGTSHTMARLLEYDWPVVSRTGDSQDLEDQFQIYPVNMVDVSQEVVTGSYSVLTSLSEVAANVIPFSPTATGKIGAEYHSRMGFYVHRVGEGYDTLEVVLHNISNSVLYSTNFALASLVAVTWNYADISIASLALGSDYHYHIYMAGFTTGTVPILGMGTTQIAFREMYKPQAGKFGGVNTNDVVHLFDKAGNEIVAVRAEDADDIDVSGGYIASGHDYVAVDLSNNTIWSTWEYNDFIGVDLATGRLKFPASIDCRNVLANFNSAVSLGSVEDKDILIHNSNLHLREKLANIDTAQLQADSEITQNSGSIMQLQTELERERQLNLQQELELSYIMGRKAQNSDMILEPYFNKDLDGLDETSSNKPAEYQCDNDWNNNWKQRDGSPDFKNGYMRPRKQAYMLEVVDEYDLEGVGLTYKGALKHDATNNCYWMISHAGANAIGEITKLHESMADGKVQVLGRWYIPAGGATTYWTGIDSDGSYIYFVLAGANAASKFGKIAINADGTLGKLNKKNGETIVNDNTCLEYALVANGATGWWNDVISYNAADIGILLCNTSTAVTVPFFAKSNGGAGAASTITGLANYIGGGDSIGRSMDYDGTNWWFRVNNITTADVRWIYKVVASTDIVSNAVIKTSGRFETTRNVDREAVPSEGICIGHLGDILEVTSTASNGKFISRRALKNALWAENQVSGELKCYASTNPAAPVACMIEYTGGDYYYWTGDYNVSADQVDIYRFKPSDGTYKHARLTNKAWTVLYDLTYNPNTDVLYLAGYDATNYEIILGDLSDFVALMGDSYNTGNTIALDTGAGGAWGSLAAGIGGGSTDKLYGICYDSDSDVILVINDTDDKIDTLSLNGATWTQGVYDLPAATTAWYGVAYKNGNIYIRDLINSTVPYRIYVLNKSLSTNTAMWRAHIYQDPSPTFVASGSFCFDFKGDEIVQTHYTNLTFTTMKVLEDPDVMQLHTFMDANNILLSSNVSCVTAIAERYFDPEDFADPRDCPDLHYCAVGYGDNGFSELHLDEYLSGKSSTGKDRYDVSKIRVRHYAEGANNVVSTAAAVTNAIFIEKDMIFVGENAGESLMIDLKSGKSIWLFTSNAGYYYNGTLSQRNDGLNYTGSANAELVTSHATFRKFHARTFSKEDASDYNLENPKTFVSIGTDGGNDVLVIDWDENGNRTPVKVWNNVGNFTTLGARATHIAISGTILMGDNGTGGAVYKGNFPIWQLGADTGYAYNNALLSTQIGSNILGTYTQDISQNSRCWKTSSGTWRHIALFAGYESGGGGDVRLAFVDIENATQESIHFVNSGGTVGWTSVDTWEDLVFAPYYQSPSSLAILRKRRFNAKIEANIYNNWDAYDGGTTQAVLDFAGVKRPIFFRAGNSEFNVVRYSKDFGLLGVTTNTFGLQFFHIGQLMDECLSQTTEISLSRNPRKVYFKQNIITGFEE